MALLLFFLGIVPALRESVKSWLRHASLRKVCFKFSDWFGDLFAGFVVTVGSAVVIVLGLSVIIDWLRRPESERIFLFLRSAPLMSGVSILLPTLLVSVVGFMWGFTMLTRLRLMEGLPRPWLNVTQGRGSLAGVVGLEEKISRTLTYGFHSFPLWPLTFLVAGVALLLIDSGLLLQPLSPSLAGPAYDLFIQWSFFLANYVLVLTFLRLIWTWLELKPLLRQFSWHPIAEAFRRLPHGPTWAPFTGWTGRTVTFADIEYLLERGIRFVRKLEEEEGAPQPTLDKTLQKAQKSYRAGLCAQADGDWRTALMKRNRTLVHLSKICRPVLDRLEAFWETGQRSDIPPDAKSSKAPMLMQVGEEFIAGRSAIFLQNILSHTRNFAGFVVVGLVLILFAIISYPFQPKQLLLTYSWIVILTVVVAILLIVVQLDRDTILSYMAGTVPGRLNWTGEFALRLITYILVPLLSLLAAQFPAIGAGVVEWIQTFVAAVPSGIFGPE